MADVSERDKQEARQIVVDGFDTVSRFPNAKIISQKLTDAIAAALAEQREQDAKIAEDHNVEHSNDARYEYQNCGLSIATAIRASGKGGE